MADETIITWNATNWVTVVVMVAIGFTVLAVAAQFFHNWRARKQAA
jgi:hypothetical protein